jgi:hypothetical protein
MLSPGEHDMRNSTTTLHRAAAFALAGLLTVGLAACKKEEAAAPAAAAAVAVPTSDDANAWQAYATDVVKKNMDGVTNSPFVYYLPAESATTFQDEYDAQLEKVKTDITRGILEGNMLAFVSPASAKMADLVAAAFAEAEPNGMKGVKVLFIGQAADSERVKAAVSPAGVNYVFVEAK